jgi:hypothetical protein
MTKGQQNQNIEQLQRVINNLTMMIGERDEEIVVL